MDEQKVVLDKDEVDERYWNIVNLIMDTDPVETAALQGLANDLIKASLDMREVLGLGQQEA